MSQESVSDAPASKPAWFKNPAAIVLVVVIFVGVLFGSSFVWDATHPSKEGSLNYNGTAQVVGITETTTKCFIHIRREDGSITKQPMAKPTCRQVREGDTIKIVNGTYQP